MGVLLASSRLAVAGETGARARGPFYEQAGVEGTARAPARPIDPGPDERSLEEVFLNPVAIDKATRCGMRPCARNLR
jgi:hypothetical protein